MLGTPMQFHPISQKPTNPMKKQTLLFLLASTCAIIMSGCGNGRLRAVHTVAVDGSKTTRPKRMEYTSQKSDTADLVGALTLGPGLLMAAVHHGMISGPRNEITNAAASKEVAIEKIVPAAFADEMARSGLFTVATQGGADATFRINVPSYSLLHKSMFGGPALAPGVMVEALLADNNGHTFYGIHKAGVAEKEHWHTHEEYRNNPELLRAGWDEAARAATREIIAKMRKKVSN